MHKSFYINLNTLCIPKPTEGLQIFAEGLLGLNILCLILIKLGYRINNHWQPLNEEGQYIDQLESMMVSYFIGIPSGAVVDVIPISTHNYLIQFYY